MTDMLPEPKNVPNGGQLTTRRTPMAAHGTPTVWMMGGGLVISVVMILGLLGLIAAEGLAAFWPRAIDRVELRDGTEFFGQLMRREVFTPVADAAEEAERAREVDGLLDGAFDDEDRPVRALYHVGNRDLGQPTFEWVNLYDVASVERPDEAVLVERGGWGVWLGTVEAVYTVGSDGNRSVLQQKPLDDRERFEALLANAQEREAELDALRSDRLASLSRAREAERLRLAEVRQRVEMGERDRSLGLWAVSVLGVAFAGGGLAFGKRAFGGALHGAGALASGARAGLWVVLIGGVIGTIVERPWATGLTPEQGAALLATVQAEHDEAVAELEVQAAAVREQVDELDAVDATVRVEFREPRTGQAAPERPTRPDQFMRLSQVDRVVPVNQMSFGETLGVYFARWGDYLSQDPRDANTAGGVFPVIFGTVVLTILLSLAVVPLGVIAAVYLREYARQGVLTSVIRIAVNNLAGVPSVVYGVFGLGFFCYGLGQYVDAGPAAPMPRMWWWGAGLGVAVIVGGAAWLGVTARGDGRPESRRHGLAFTSGVLWVSAVAVVGLLIATTPYFGGFFSAKAAEDVSTFGSRGILWASLTLALLTLPVVIVATEEAIAAVPQSMREGSYGCGASKWETIRRIVLPGALPGIMTGAILAMARGAGEVAPLMLVGAVKWAPELAVSGDAPFLHFDRTFMHLGFHIYDLGFQSPDPEAARPLVWTTTLLLILIVLALNLSAMLIRGRLRGRLGSGAI